MARKSRRFRHRRGVKKTKRRTRSLKRKTLRRKSKKTKRKTRKKSGGKKVNMFRLNMDIDSDLDHAKKSLTPQSSHPGDLSLQFFSTPTRLQKRLSNYPTSPPVIKGMFGTNQKKTQEAQNLYHRGLQNQKTKLEYILNDAFEEEKYFKKSGEELPPKYMIGHPVTTDAILNALDQPNKRLGQPNNLRTKVNQWRQSNTN